MTHGTSNRLHANGSGLLSAQSGGLGEGWSDFYARALLSAASEDVNGVFAAGSFVTLNIANGFTDNYYYGIRRFPYAVKTTVGGNGKPHNPLTYADIDPAQIDITDGAYPRGPIGSPTASEVHNIGEVWAMMLFEARARVITRLGFAAGNPRMLQIVTDGMKLDPASPTLIQARNSILAADCAGFAGADEIDVWNGFATRGLAVDATTSGTATVTESFIPANLKPGAISFTDSACNGNGFADPDENLVLSVPVSNYFCATSISGATVTIVGNSASYPTLAPAASASQTVPYHVPAGAACGSLITLPVVFSSSLGTFTVNYPLAIGQTQPGGFTQNFDAAVVPALPAGWTTAHTGAAGVDWVTSPTNPSSAPNDAFSPDPATISTSDLLSSPIPVATANAQLSFRNLYNLESTFDGMVLEISNPAVNAGAFQDIVAAGGSFVSGGYNGVISSGFSSPIAARAAWTGLSGGTTAAPAYITTVVKLPSSAFGQSISLKWRVGTDSSTSAGGAAGARVDTIDISTTATCASTTCTPLELTTFEVE